MSLIGYNTFKHSKKLSVTGYVTGFWLHLTCWYILCCSSCNHVTKKMYVIK